MKVPCTLRSMQQPAEAALCGDVADAVAMLVLASNFLISSTEKLLLLLPLGQPTVFAPSRGGSFVKSPPACDKAARVTLK